jgi:hypothetical protein
MGGQQSNLLVKPPVPQRTWNKQHFEEIIQGQGLVLDDSKKEFLKYNGDVLEKIKSGDFASANRFRQLLIGRKGVGKTELMKLLAKAAKAAGDVIVVYIEYSAPEQAFTPFDEAYRCLPVDVKEEYERLCEDDRRNATVYKYGWLNEALYNCKRTLLFLVDEVPLVYGKVCTNGVSIISELHVIGGLDGRSIHCILSGSGKYVRKLAFCKLDDILKPQYPNYSTVDLNSTRYVPRYILPFSRSTADFKHAVEGISKSVKRPRNYNNSELAILFKRSGGCAGSLHTLLMEAESQPYTTSAKGIAQLTESKISFLKDLFLALDIVNSVSSSTPLASDDSTPVTPDELDETPTDSGGELIDFDDELEKLFLRMRPVPLAMVKTSGFLDIAIVYELVDDGFIHYFQDNTVSFALPSLYDELDSFHGQNKGITLTELVNLKNHYKDGLACEPTVLRLLAQSSMKIFDCELKY